MGRTGILVHNGPELSVSNSAGIRAKLEGNIIFRLIPALFTK